MAIHNRTFVRGCTLWWNSRPPGSVWLELGREKANAFLSTNRIGKTFLLLIPPPWGPMAYGLAAAILRDISKKMGPNGLWVKFNLAGYVTARPRTPANMQRAPPLVEDALGDLG